MPRSWHSFTSYFSCMATGSPHLLQNVGVFLLNVPHLWQITSPVWYGLVDHRRAAMPARGAQVMQPLQVSALALPVPDGVVHEIQLRHFAEIPDRKHGSEHGLQVRRLRARSAAGPSAESADRTSSALRSDSESGSIPEFSRSPAAGVPGHVDFYSACVLPHPFLGSLEINRKAAGAAALSNECSRRRTRLTQQQDAAPPAQSERAHNRRRPQKDRRHCWSYRPRLA